jgi:cysteine desulfurase/selenocysteine lyase
MSVQNISNEKGIQHAGPKEGRAESPGLDIRSIRGDFPILDRRIHGNRLVYLDSAATSQKPECVIEAIGNYYRNNNANVHRGIYTISEEATTAYENARSNVARFVGAESHEIIFTRNATEAINLVAYAYARSRLKEGDEVLLTEMEHHSNLIPWILLANQTGVKLRHIPIKDDGTLEMERLEDYLTERTRIVSVVHKSNVLGTINPVRELIRAAREKNAVVLLDGAQSVPHTRVDVKELDCDFLAFSGHKMLGPTGVGVLYGKTDLLQEMDPFLGGGEMIREVHLDRATWNDLPWKFEAGTPAIAPVIAFSAAIDYLEKLGMDAIRSHEIALTDYALQRLGELSFISVYGPDQPDLRSGVISFLDHEIHPHDLSTILDTQGIAIRAGHHCAQPLMQRFGVIAMARASLYLYNDRDDIDALVDALKYARRYFGYDDS